MKKTIIGRLENINLTELSIDNLPTRIDTGAQTSSLHVDNIKTLKIKGKPAIQFDIHPQIHNVDEIITCCAPIHDIRKVKSSNGVSEQRYVIKTPISLGDINWDIEITLTDRSDMSYLMLLGRQALSNRFLVDPSEAFMYSSELNDTPKSEFGDH